MSFLWRTSGCVVLQFHQLSPVSRALLNTRVQSPISQQLRRPFNSTAFRLSYFPNGDLHGPPKSGQPRKHPPQQSPEPHFDHHEDYGHRPPPPPPQSFDAPNIVVGGILGVCVAMYGYLELVKLSIDSNPSSKSRAALRALETHFVQTPKNIKEGRYYTIVTSAFMHKNLMHLLFNSIALWSLGRPVVSLIGAPSFLVLYFGSVVAGGLFQEHAWERQKQWNVGAMGASGGVLGVFAAMTCIDPRSRIALFFIPMPMWVGAAIIVGTSVGGMQDRWLPSIGHADHLGGMAFGALWWLLAMRRGKLSFRG